MSEAQQMSQEQERLRAQAKSQAAGSPPPTPPPPTPPKDITPEEPAPTPTLSHGRAKPEKYRPIVSIGTRELGSYDYEQSLQERAAKAVPIQTFKETASVAQATRSVSAAETAIKQAESMSENWGSKIQWGDKEYNLGTTQGYKDFKQAIRDAKSDINQAKNTLKLYESGKWSERTSRKAKEAVEKANRVIEKANKIIAQQNVEVEKIVEANKKLIEAKFTHDYKPMTKEEYRKQQIEDTYNYLTAFVMQDIADEDKVERTISQVAPIYISQGQGGGEFQKWMNQIERLKRDAEARAEWRAQEGKAYKDRMKPENRPTLQQIGARLEHLGLSAGQGAIYAAPIAAITALGGPLATGIVVAGTVATFANPKNRYETALFIGEHPEEFFASIAGALAAGMTVSKVQQLWGKYKTQLSIKQRAKLEAKWDKLIDDYTYLEQRLGSEFPSQVEKAQLKAKYLRDYPDVFEKMIDDYAYGEQLKGAEFPSRAIEIPEPYGKKIIISDPIDPEAAIFQRFIQELSQKNPSEAFEAYVKGMKDAKLAMYYQEAGGVLEPTLVEEIINKYPELRDPFLHPAFADPNVLAKSNLVARVNEVFKHPALMDPSILDKPALVARLTSSNMAVSPLLSAALAIVANQGYITSAQIKQLIKVNSSLIEAYKQAGIQIVTPWTIQDLKNIQLSEAAQVVSVIPVQLADTLAIQEVLQVQAQVVEQVPVTEVEPLLTEPTPTEPTPTEPTPTEIPPKTVPPPFSPPRIEEEEKKRKLGTLRFYQGKKRSFRVVFTYPRGGKETVKVEARSYAEACQLAQRSRRIGRDGPVEVNLWVQAG